MPEIQVVSRIAPTPSGFLHKGNAFNFLLTYLLVRYHNGKLWLRIDDIDDARSRPEFIEDIYDTLDWLEMQPDFGPSGPKEFTTKYSQQLHMGEYRQAVESLLSRGLAYACKCSRKQIKRLSRNGIYPGTCRLTSDKAFSVPHAIRCALGEEASRVEVPSYEESSLVLVNLRREMGDFVLWRKDNVAAYQVASVCDDIRMGTNLLVRGEDLLLSSAAQLWLSGHLAEEGLQKASFIHHSLLMEADNRKLSKSEGSLSLKAMREEGLSSGSLLKDFCRWMNMPFDQPADLQELAEAFAEWFGQSGRLP
ncbi:glutamate--tRNA ligase family protein [Roseivirga sp. BDSF3-8]|uniref:glutamate--tRNA ligase family protein n=1 Tax=Roseivirga sp. BDSF3-8 TaxID=3241598 RepID=UPI0035325FD9